jgi:ABC-type lipopolysaccharide export system ATPase subunit
MRRQNRAEFGVFYFTAEASVFRLSVVLEVAYGTVPLVRLAFFPLFDAV